MSWSPHHNESSRRSSYQTEYRDYKRDSHRNRDDDGPRRTGGDYYPQNRSYQNNRERNYTRHDARDTPPHKSTGQKEWNRRSPNVRLEKIKAELNRFKVYKNSDRFEIGDQVGEGTYGQVFKARDSHYNTFVALKKLFISEDEKGKEKNRDGFPITAIREIEILRSLNHCNIVELKAMISISKEMFGMDMYMVFEYMDHDLTGILNDSGVIFRVPHIKCLGKQLFQGLEYLHQKQIIHRDIKGANLLLNNQGYLKIADFGLARRIHIDKTTGEPLENYEYTNRVVTLWYRSPELLLGSTNYSFEVDIWSAGCILLEFYVRQAVFRGNTEIQQLNEIFKFCGSPTEENWPGINNLPWTGLVSYDHKERILRQHFSDPSFGLSVQFINLLDALLTLDPSKRPGATEALLHPYFTKEEPFACVPSALPGIEGDWHEYEGKIRQRKLAAHSDLNTSQTDNMEIPKETKRSAPPVRADSENTEDRSKRQRFESSTPIETKDIQLPSNPEDTMPFHQMYSKPRKL